MIESLGNISKDVCGCIRIPDFWREEARIETQGRKVYTNEFIHNIKNSLMVLKGGKGRNICLFQKTKYIHGS